MQQVPLKIKVVEAHNYYFKEPYKLGNENWKIRYFTDLLSNNIPFDAKILDLGCGALDSLLFLNWLGYTNTFGTDKSGLDPSSYKISIDELNNKVHFLKNDFDSYPLPYPNSFFDVIYSFDCIEYLKNPLQVLDESNRVLRNGGLFFITTANAVNLHKRIITLLGKNPQGLLEHFLNENCQNLIIREYTMHEMKQLMELVELTPKQTRYYKQCSNYQKKLLRIYNLVEAMYPKLSARFGITAIKK
jgi:SAM-dependent methyltransferase